MNNNGLNNNRSRETALVISQEEISEGIFDLKIKFRDDYTALKNTLPGQFVSLYVSDGSMLLPRPISICEANVEDMVLRLVYRVVGSGTKAFSSLRSDDTIDVIAPLGNGYDFDKIISENNLPDDASFVAMGGGIGIPPMLGVVKKLHEIGKKAYAVLGYRSNDLFLIDDFKKYSEVIISTDDGSVGTKGTVIDALKASGVKADVILSCGPLPMLRGISSYASENNIPAYVSLEEHMACGIGACLGCVCKTVDVDEHSHVNNTRICTEGPVFRSSEVIL